MTRLTDRAWQLLREGRMEFDGRFVGVRASCDTRTPRLNYDQCFVRDFAVCAPAFLVRDEYEIVRNFLVAILSLQSKETALVALKPREGLMPASFRPMVRQDTAALEPDYGEESIARVTPADSGFWWLLTLRAYTKASGDTDLASREDVQDGIRRVLRLALAGSFEMFPTLLVPDGSFMIDRRLGVYGHPLEVQALFFAALRSADELYAGDDDLASALRSRLRNLRHHVGRYYWLDQNRLASLHHMERDEYGEEVVNVFNVYPRSIPGWVEEWIPDNAGYLVGNVGPGRIDFRYFAQGNLLSVATGLCDEDEGKGLLRLYEERWTDLMGPPAPRIVFPALEGEAWRVLTGADSKNEPWSYHNGGLWPCLLWSFACASVAWDRPDLLERAVEQARLRLDEDDWPEYYEGRKDAVPGERARRLQSWSMGGYLFAEACLEDPSIGELYRWTGDVPPREAGTEESARSGRPSSGDGNDLGGSGHEEQTDALPGTT